MRDLGKSCAFCCKQRVKLGPERLAKMRPPSRRSECGLLAAVDLQQVQLAVGKAGADVGEPVSSLDKQGQLQGFLRCRQLRIGLGLALLPTGSWLICQQGDTGCHVRPETLFNLGKGYCCVFHRIVQISDRHSLSTVWLDQGRDRIKMVRIGVLAILLRPVRRNGKGAG